MNNQVSQVRETAEKYYRDGDYLCSEAVFTVINDYLGNPVPREAVCLASGFPVGIGMAGCTCGALTGGVMALGLNFGRRIPGAEMPGMFEAAKKLHDDFKEQFGSTCCRVLIREFEFGSPEHLEHCINVTGCVAEMVMNQIHPPARE
ncbi:MAG TPA: C-GCAxxG-C-C family protein [Bacillota bacterium]|nr:C-GCAxxG-C-C family protein [Bacillota bacterium]